MIELLAQISFGLSLLAALLALFNFFTLESVQPNLAKPISKKVAILIPFRNEINNVTASIASAKAQSHLPNLKVFVLDDFSQDGTDKLIDQNSGVIKVAAKTLPEGWLGKLWACWQLAEYAESDFKPDYLVFLDADVRLDPTAISATINEKSDWDFISPYPKQLTKGFIPFIFQPLLQWSWLSSIPLTFAHRFKVKSMIVANGQFFIVKKSAYFKVDGHRGIKNQVLDDLQLARKLSAAKYQGGVLNASRVSKCLMYETSAQLFSGYQKSLWAGFGGVFGSVLAFVILFLTGFINFIAAANHSLLADSALLILLSRILSSFKTGGDLRSVIFHPLAIITLLYLLLTSWVGKIRGTLTWRDRKLI